MSHLSEKESASNGVGSPLTSDTLSSTISRIRSGARPIRGRVRKFLICVMDAIH